MIQADWLLNDLVLAGMVLGFAFVVLGAVVLYFEADARRAMEEREKRAATSRLTIQDLVTNALVAYLAKSKKGS